jgi:hypothetical protein
LSATRVARCCRILIARQQWDIGGPAPCRAAGACAADVALACDRMGGSPFATPCILGPHAHSEQLEGCGCGSCGSECCSMLSRRRRDQACPAARDIASLERADPMSGRSATAEIRPGCKHGPALAVAIGAGVTPGLSRQVTCERRIEARAHHAVGRDRRWLCIGRSHPRSSDRPIEDDCVSSRSRGNAALPRFC